MTSKPKFTTAKQANEALARAREIIAAADAQMDELTRKQVEEESALLQRVATVMKELIDKRGIEAGLRILHRAQKLLAGDFGKPKGAKKPNRAARRDPTGAQDARSSPAD